MPERHSVSPTRRTVLTAAAWTVPTVALASAAPAYAASSGALRFSAAPTAEIRQVGTSKLFHGSLAVENSHTAATQNLQIVVALPGAYATANPTPLVINGGAPGWSTTTAGRSDGFFVYTFTATAQLAARSSTHVTFDMELRGTVPASPPPITVTANASNVGSVSAAASPRFVG